MTRRQTLAIVPVGLLVAAAAIWLTLGVRTVRVGVIHDHAGATAASEHQVLEATLLAIEQLNDAGGVRGRRVVPVVPEIGRPGGPPDFPTAVDELLADGVTTFFGVWTSKDRRAITARLEGKALLYYPVFYEGLEACDEVIYLGATANQRILPAVRWARMRFGPDFFLVGSDYIFPRAANELIQQELARMSRRTGNFPRLPVHYFPLDESDHAAGEFADLARTIRDDKPQVVVNTINGTWANRAFFQALRDAGVDPRDTTVLSFAIGEVELDAMPEGIAADHYVAWSYLESLPVPENRDFLALWRAHSPNTPVSEPMVGGFTAVMLWAEAARLAKSFDPLVVREQTLGLAISAPGGVEYIDKDNGHAWRSLRIARIMDSGELEVVWDQPAPIAPDPWPEYRLDDGTLFDWQRFVQEVQRDLAPPGAPTRDGAGG